MEESLPNSNKHHVGLTWRSDPATNFSDWTIVVGGCHNNNHERHCRFHVHKCVLAAESGYFRRLWSHSFREHEQQTSLLCFPEEHRRAASAVPTFLDLIYYSTRSNNDDHRAMYDSTNAVALKFLAEYLDCQRLRTLLEDFCRRDLTADTCGDYYEQAVIFHDETIRQAVLELCYSRAILQIPPSSKLVLVTDADFWCTVLDYYADQGSVVHIAARYHLSLLVGSFCRAREDMKDSLPLKDLLQLTAERYLPEIDYRAAPFFLAAADRCLQKDDLSSDQNQLLQNLQARCIRALASNWTQVEWTQTATTGGGVPNNNDTSALFLSQLDPSLIVQLYLQTVTQARHQYTQLLLEQEQLGRFRRIEAGDPTHSMDQPSAAIDASSPYSIFLT